ncbi:hypothetical protein G4B88_029861 [Cannabis sativa]|uniref:MATH domain-containing protein n=1 Tax=Cannabis sativa TaxID=3483 RepID=A0A7J6GEW2_CANSA|nr:hypothetical protein G4B88_029861 [Cannabis sativa]
MKVESYSLLSMSSGKYDSSSFKAGGYKWILTFYPNGDKRFDTNNDYVSLYLTISESNVLPKGWEVNDESNGYIFNDSCAFGAEVFVINHTTLNSETLSFFQRGKLANPIFRWEIKEWINYVTNRNNSILEEQIGDQRRDGKSFSKFLKLVDSRAPNNSTIYVEFCFRVIDQINSKHKKLSAENWFRKGRGFQNFMLLEDLHKSSNGYIVKDTLIVEVEFFVISQTY